MPVRYAGFCLMLLVGTFLFWMFPSVCLSMPLVEVPLSNNEVFNFFASLVLQYGVIIIGIIMVIKIASRS